MKEKEKVRDVKDRKKLCDDEPDKVVGGNDVMGSGKPGLTVGRVFTDGRMAPYEIILNGVTAGWAPAASIGFTGN